MRRIMGTEVEYGIVVPGDATANPVLTSTHIVLAYAAAADIPRARRARWDYEVESPLRDARGFDLGAAAPQNNGSDSDDLGAANVILTNGARLYVDHAHPEYSAPEVTNPRDVVVWDKAGERIMEEAALKAASVPGTSPMQLYKNNVDGKGASYGTHENYLMARDTPFTAVIGGLTPFFASRQVMCGSGRVGLGQAGEKPGFQLSQRSDYIEVEVGLETTLKRGIINTRDEPHADAERYRRLHVIVGDSNMSEVTTLLKVGTAHLVLEMIEAGVQFRDFSLDNPIRAIREISHDMTGRRTVRLAGGREASALDIQREYHSRALDYVERRGSDPMTDRLLDLWGRALDAVETQDYSLIDREVDWAIKHRLLERYRTKHGLELSSPRIAQLDLAYHDIRRGRGLFDMLQRKDLVDRATEDGEIEAAKDTPPQSTRAKLRGDFIAAAQSAGRDFTVDWVHLKLNDQAQRTVLCKDPFRAVDERVERLIGSL